MSRMAETLSSQVANRLHNFDPIIHNFKLPTLDSAWVKVEFVGIGDIKSNKISLKYKLTASHEDELWETRKLWKDELKSYLDSKLSIESDGNLEIRQIKVTKGSLLFGIDIAIIGGIAAIITIINGLITLGKHIADFFRWKPRWT